MYRRDRLFTSDKERINCLQETLKNVRITDETAYFNSLKPVASPDLTRGNTQTTLGSSPVHRNNTIGGKHNNGGGPGPSGGSGGSGAAGGASGGGATGFTAGKHSSSVPPGEGKSASGAGTKGNSDYSS